MIPVEVGNIASLIFPEWGDADEDVFKEVIDAAWRIYNAGYRKQPEPETAQSA